MSRDQGTFAAFALARLGDLQDRVRASSDFKAWLGGHQIVMVDGERFYLTEGDHLVDGDEMEFNWARRRQLVDEATIERLQAKYQPGIGEVSP